MFHSQGEINTARHIASVARHLWVIIPPYVNEEMGGEGRLKMPSHITVGK